MCPVLASSRASTLFLRLTTTIQLALLIHKQQLFPKESEEYRFPSFSTRLMCVEDREISTTKLINIYLPHTTQHSSYGLSYGNSIMFIVPVASGKKILRERTQFNLCYNRENFRNQLFLGVTKSSLSIHEREYWHSYIQFSCSVLRSGQQLRNGRADHELDSYQLVSFLGG